MTSQQPTDPVADALQRVLASQHAAVYGYPLIGVRLAVTGQLDRARELEAAHRLTRDALRAQLVARRLTPVAADPQYRPVAPVTDPAGGWAWAVQLEEACAAGYRYLLAATVQAGGSQLALRQQALAGLTDAAQNATGWRLLLSPVTPTVPFPGL